jgi:hypothetical protein
MWISRLGGTTWLFPTSFTWICHPVLMNSEGNTCDCRSTCEWLVVHEQSVSHTGNLSQLCLLRKGTRSQDHGQQETDEPSGCAHCLQLRTSDLQYMAFLWGKWAFGRLAPPFSFRILALWILSVLLNIPTWRVLALTCPFWQNKGVTHD